MYNDLIYREDMRYNIIKFKTKLGIKKDYINCNIIKSIINCPVTMKGKCIGVITDYNLNTDEAYGFLIDNLCQNDNIHSHSVEVIYNV